MNRITQALKATYNFFAGDAILLGATVLAFLLTFFVTHVTSALMIVASICLLGCISGGLALTLAREVRGRPRLR